MHVRTPCVGTLGGLQTAPHVVAGPRREWRKPKPMMNNRFEEVGWGHTTCEGGEQGSASLCGVAGGKGLNQGESGVPKHVPNPVSGKRATGGGPDTGSFCRQSPEVGAGWFNDHVRICAGGAQHCAFLPQLRGVRSNPYSYRNWEPRVGNPPRPPGCNQFVRLAPMANDRPDIRSRHEIGNAS